MHSEDPGPNLLPLQQHHLVDRGPEVAVFDLKLAEAMERGQPLFFGCTGPHGIGKTTLVNHLAYRVLPQFPDCQLYASLGGSSPTGPVEPSEVLYHFLIQLKVPSDQIPAGEAERAAVFRSHTANKRLILFLDDVASVAQVVPLLPSSPTCVVMVTARPKLTAAARHGFHLAPLEPFSREFAVQMIAQSVDSSRLEAEPDAFEQLLGLCAGVPLSLSVVAATLGAPTRRLSRLVRKTTTASAWNAQVDDELQSIGMVLGMSYDELTADQARAYRLLGLHPGPEFDLRIAAAVLEIEDEDDALDVLEELVEANLLEAVAADRFKFHEYVRRHAHDRAVAETPPSERVQAQRLLVTAYAHRAIALVKALYRRWWAAEGFEQIPADHSADALSVLETERVNLLAALLLADEISIDEVVPAFCEALGHWYYQSDRVADLKQTQQLGVAAAKRVGDRGAEMRLHNQWGTAYEAEGDFEAALEQFTLSLALAKAIGHVLGEQSATEWTGIVLGAQGFLAAAIDALHESLRIAERIADPGQRERAIALTTMHLGRLTSDASSSADVDTLKTVLRYFHDHDEQVNEARTLVNLADLGGEREPRQALPLLERAVELFGSQKFLSQQASALRKLAEVEDRLGDHKSADGHRRDADELTRQQL